MTGILSQALQNRYLSGIGTDPLNQQGGLDAYVNQYNVNDYWKPYLQGSGLLGTLAQQQYTQGNQNPYYQPEQPQAAAAPKAASPLSVLSGGMRQGQWQGNTGVLNPNAGQFTDMILSDGRVVPGSMVGDYWQGLQTSGNKDENRLNWMKLQGGKPLFDKGASVPEALLKLIGG